jgi:hypothetical protein
MMIDGEIEIELKTQLSVYGNNSDTINDVIRKLLRNVRLDSLFIASKKLGSQREAFFLKVTDQNGEIIESAYEKLLKEVSK